MAFIFCVYGFLGIIMLVSVLNIINNVSMSVSARTKQYGVMRAVGMDGYQILKMIAAEAVTYAICGCVAGGIIGLSVNKFLYKKLITDHFPYAIWNIPVSSLFIILLFVIFATGISIYGPVNRIRNISVTETINEL